jgi:hypothetical protein
VVLEISVWNISTQGKIDNLYSIQILDNEELERKKSIQGRAKVINGFIGSAVVDRLEGFMELLQTSANLSRPSLPIFAYFFFNPPQDVSTIR